jgi:hypothetical protein
MLARPRRIKIERRRILLLVKLLHALRMVEESSVGWQKHMHTQRYTVEGEKEEQECSSSSVVVVVIVVYRLVFSYAYTRVKKTKSVEEEAKEQK